MKQLNFDFSGNLGGLSRMFAIPVKSYKRIRRDHTNSLNYLEVINRDDIIDIYITEDTGLFKEDFENGAYKVQITGINPKSNKLNQEQLKRLESEKYWFVLFLDNNNNVRLAGTEENQPAFTRTDTTGQMDSRNQIEFAFTGVQSDACEFIELEEMDDL